MRLISVVMGTRSEEARAQESQKLLSYGFRYYRTHQLYNANETLNSATVWSGMQDQLRVGLDESLAVTIPRGQVDQLEAVMDIDKVIKAPVTKGEVYGKVNILLNGEQVSEVPLIALEDIPEAGLVKRIWHAVMLFFMGLIS